MSYPDDWSQKGTADTDNSLVLSPAYEGNASLNIGDSANENQEIYPGSETDQPSESQIITWYQGDPSGDSTRIHPSFVFYFQDTENYYAWQPLYGADQGAKKFVLMEKVNGNQTRLLESSYNPSRGLWHKVKATVWVDSGSTFFRIDWDDTGDGSYNKRFETTVSNPAFSGGGVGIGSGDVRSDSRGGYFDQTEILY